jgi:hypothetical protein
MRACRFAPLVIAALSPASAEPLSAFDGAQDTEAFDSAPAQAAGKVYIFRAMGGNFATPEMDMLAGKIAAHGLEAEVFSYLNWVHPANEAIARYRGEAAKSPIIAVGHSAGGDSAIRFAQWLKRADVPVNLIVTLDPTRVASRVPGNVQRFVNIYCSSNALGGGAPLPARDFHGHFASVDLKNYPNVWHVYLPRISGLQDKVVAKIVEVAARPVVDEGPATKIEYPMPRGEPIELWDSGLPISVEDGETVASVAAKYGVPVWLIAEINKVDPASRLSAGRQLIVPRHLGEDTPSNE